MNYNQQLFFNLEPVVEAQSADACFLLFVLLVSLLAVVSLLVDTQALVPNIAITHNKTNLLFILNFLIIIASNLGKLPSYCRFLKQTRDYCLLLCGRQLENI